MKNKKEHSCPNCGQYGVHYWHHVYNGALKKKSEQYNAIEYWCDYCHIWGKDSIHNNAYLRRTLKQQHQRRIMEEESWSTEEFISAFGENYL